MRAGRQTSRHHRHAYRNTSHLSGGGGKQKLTRSYSVTSSGQTSVNYTILELSWRASVLESNFHFLQQFQNVYLKYFANDMEYVIYYAAPQLPLQHELNKYKVQPPLLRFVVDLLRISCGLIVVLLYRFGAVSYFPHVQMLTSVV